jgi:hypothetical protein
VIKYACTNVTIRSLLLTDDLAAGSFTVNGLHKVIDQMAKFCNKWNTTCNFGKKLKLCYFKVEEN